MSKPFNDEPVEQLIPKLLSEDGKSLDLRLKYIGDDGLKIVAGTDALRGLEVLNLERNDIGPEGIRALAESQVITGLVELHLERNDLGDEGTRIIAEASNFSNLKYLNLWKNKVGSEGAEGSRSVAVPVPSGEVGYGAEQYRR